MNVIRKTFQEPGKKEITTACRSSSHIARFTGEEVDDRYFPHASEAKSLRHIEKFRKLLTSK